MHDLVIRDALIIDGTGAAARSGDVALDGDRITAVGGKLGRGHREIKADGLFFNARLGGHPYPLRWTGDLGRVPHAILAGIG